MESYCKDSDWHQGYEDARNGFPRESTRASYRAGYDRGLTESNDSWHRALVPQWGSPKTSDESSQ